MEYDISRLREQRRPLWMTDFGIESFADMLGGGGDIYSDRLTLDWARNSGVEAEEEVEERIHVL
ncbi:MAG: hypothetical protein HPY84_15680 [Syntrophobacteraceae bacterium]|nr:hypothetical protein [Syntrophobacteraceae bacterium]